MENKGEIVVYQLDEITSLEVRVENDNVWLNRAQLALLFGRDIKTIGKHVSNALKEELYLIPTVANFATVQKEGTRYVERQVEYYNLDMILSVGYRVKSEKGVLFRRWANQVLKDHLLKGYSINNRISLLEKHVDSRISECEKRLDAHGKQIEFFVRTAIPPVEGVFFDGQIFDAYVFVADLIKSAKCYLVLIDNYIDESVLILLSKRTKGVTAEIRTCRLTSELQMDVQKHNLQYPAINIIPVQNIHDRFLIVDDVVYHIGASLKDLGKKLFAFSKMTISPQMLL